MTNNTKLTLINFSDKNNTGRIEYIVIHFVGGVSTAKNNADYFYNKYVGASAHYFVDENEIWQIVDDADIAWHVGATSYKHPYCRNTNSLGIEMCCKKDSSGNFYFEQRTIQNTITLTKTLMQKYGVPLQNVLRHYDVTGKLCPEPFVRDASAWNDFKSQLIIPASPTPQDCAQELAWRNIITDMALWNANAKKDEDVRWLLVKYYPYILKNGGSVKSPLSVSSLDQAVNILKKQGILTDKEKWMSKGIASEDIYWLLVKLADYIN